MDGDGWGWRLFFPLAKGNNGALVVFLFPSGVMADDHFLWRRRKRGVKEEAKVARQHPRGVRREEKDLATHTTSAYVARRRLSSIPDKFSERQNRETVALAGIL